MLCMRWKIKKSTSTQNLFSRLVTHAPDTKPAFLALMSSKPTVAVFGASRVDPGEPAYAQAQALGAALASAGFHIINGGYMGTMEATAAGAKSVQGGTCEGILCSPCFPHRKHGNEFLTSSTDSKSLLHRIDILTQRAALFVVLPGTIGTLAELSIAWNLSMIGGNAHPADNITILCYRDPWEKVINELGKDLELPGAHLALVQFVDNEEEVVKILKENLPAQ